MEAKPDDFYIDDDASITADIRKLDQRDFTNEKEISGKVTHLYFSSDTFSAGVIHADCGPILSREIKFSIRSRVAIGENITLHGRWINHPKFSWQFEASSVSYPMPDTAEDGLANYLATNPAFKGIGLVKAKAIAAKYWAEFDAVIREEPEKIAEIGKLSIDRVLEIRAAWCERSDINAISTWLSAYGLTHGQVKKIAAKYGNKAKTILTADPYLLIEDVDGFGFIRTDEIALKMGTPKDHPGRIRTCLLDLIRLEADEGGHTYIERKSLIKAALKKLCLDTLDAENLVRQQLTVLCGEDDARIVERDINGVVLLADRTVYERETALLAWLRDSVNHPVDVDGNQTDELINDAVASTRKTPSDSQRQAVEMVLKNRISVMSGGAGTGKSYTIALIYQIFQNCELSVGLCAPTGKAAKRMSQLADGAKAQTIHRLLEYSPITGWGYNGENKLPYDLIIVDESSMCDINLFWHLFSAIDFTTTQLLLVGDHNQLPPIGAGNVLRDILDHRIVPSHILTQCFRSAGDLKVNCNHILDGVLAKTTPVLPDGAGREWRVVDNLEDPELIIQSLCLLMMSEFARWNFDPILDCQIITPYNRGVLGVNRINLEMQRIWQKLKYNIDLPEIVYSDKEKRERRPQLMTGDKVMQVKNDYKLGPFGVMNGTTGIVQNIYDDKAEGKKVIVINFDDSGIVEIEAGSEQYKNVVLAYASTVHKVQGSEYPCLVAIIHKMHAYMLTRNLFYTAVTRARKTAIVLGDKVGMRRAIRTTTSMERRTWMSLDSTIDESFQPCYTDDVEVNQ